MPEDLEDPFREVRKTAEACFNSDPNPIPAFVFETDEGVDFVELKSKDGDIIISILNPV